MYEITMTDKGYTVVDDQGRHVFWSRSKSEASFVLEWARKQAKMDRPMEWSDM